MADFLYGSARIRVLECNIIGRERIAAILEAPSLSAAYERMEQFGVSLIRNSDGMVLREDTLLARLNAVYQTVEELATDCESLRMWRFPYDCNNFKAAIKAFYRKIDVLPMLFDFGTVKVDRVIPMVCNGTFEELPPAMQKAASDAMSAFARTQNPQGIELLMDRACYADMLSAAQAGGNAYILRLLQTRIDLLNAVMTVRAIRMRGETKAWLQASLISGGSLPLTLWMDCFEGGEAVLWRRLEHTAYAKLAMLCSGDSVSLATIERVADDVWMEQIRATKWIPFGEEVLASFLLAHEYEIKNLRIVLAGKEAGLENATIRERIRESYV